MESNCTHADTALGVSGQQFSVFNVLTGQLGISLKLGLTREASFQEMETLLVPPQV